MDRYRVSVRRACAVVKQWRPGWYYQPKEKGDGPLLKRIEEVAAVRVRYGFWRIFVLQSKSVRNGLGRNTKKATNFSHNVYYVKYGARALASIPTQPTPQPTSQRYPTP